MIPSDNRSDSKADKHPPGSSPLPEAMAPKCATTGKEPDVSCEIIHIEEALRIMNNKEKILLRCLDLFTEILPPTLNEIRRAIDRTDGEGLNRILHKFSGTLKNIAARRALMVAVQVESAGRKGDMALAKEHLDALIKECESIKTLIRRYKAKGLPH